MKVKSLLALLLLAQSCAVFARKLAPEVEHAMAYGAEAKICLKICDDMGLPVSNASVRTYFDMLPVPHSVYGKTDTNGICVVKGKTNGNKVEFLVGKDGYYGSRKETSYIPMGKEHAVKDGKWQPYGAEERVELRKIRKPRKLVDCRTFFSLPSTNAWVGFDMEKKSFVKPFGEGDVSDFDIYAEWDGLPPWKSCFCRGKMRIQGDFCGGTMLRMFRRANFHIHILRNYLPSIRKEVSVSLTETAHHQSCQRQEFPFARTLRSSLALVVFLMNTEI